MTSGRRNKNIGWDLETTPIQIITSSEAGSGDLLWVLFKPFHDPVILDNAGVGIRIIFSDPPEFILNFCQDGELFEMPAAEVHVWTLARTDCCLVLHCNGVLIMNYNIGSSGWSKCTEKWAPDMTTFTFARQNSKKNDNASKFYRAKPKGKFLFQTNHRHDHPIFEINSPDAILNLSYSTVCSKLPLDNMKTTTQLPVTHGSKVDVECNGQSTQLICNTYLLDYFGTSPCPQESGIICVS